MGASTPSTFDNDTLQAIYELRAFVLIAFVFTEALDRYFDTPALELLDTVLFVALAPLVAVVLAGLLLDGVEWVRSRR